MTFDASSIVGSTILGAIFKKLPPNKKNAALIPVLFFLMIFFIMLKAINFTVTGYFIIIALVGLCLGGSYNTMAGLVTMELVRTTPP
jgi:sugar phosphate permease